MEARSCRGSVDGALVTAFRRNRALAELEAAREEARLERTLKDRLLANMSHELRTPLNAILGFSEILGTCELTPADPQKRLEYARIIHSSAEHLLSVVNLVLDMSRIEAGKFAVAPEPLELESLIRECCDMLRLRAGKGKVEIVAAPLPEGLEIVADKAACRQILVNLLSNAIKFTPQNGRVVVEARVEGGVARICRHRQRHRHQARRSAAARRPVLSGQVGLRPQLRGRRARPVAGARARRFARRFGRAGIGLWRRHARDCGAADEAQVCIARRAASARLETIPRLTLPPLAFASATQEERRIA